MPTSVPAPFQALFAGTDEEARAATDLLRSLADDRAEVVLEVDGHRVALPTPLRCLLQRAVEHMRVRDDIARSFGRMPARTLWQPVVHLDSGDVTGFEALSDLPTRDVEGSTSWFRDAAVLGLGAEVELALLSLALEDLPSLPAAAYLSVNVSPHTVVSTELAELLATVDGSRIVLELTEHMPVDDYAALNAALSRLRDSGVRLAVDDAGAGFSSLHHILLVRPEIVKLDVSLISGVDSDAAIRSLIAGLCDFTREIGADCIAEGVETDAQLATLRELGVSHGQGWLFGPPRRRRQRRGVALLRTTGLS